MVGVQSQAPGLHTLGGQTPARAGPSVLHPSRPPPSHQFRPVLHPTPLPAILSHWPYSLLNTGKHTGPQVQICSTSRPHTKVPVSAGLSSHPERVSLLFLLKPPGPCVLRTSGHGSSPLYWGLPISFKQIGFVLWESPPPTPHFPPPGTA